MYVAIALAQSSPVSTFAVGITDQLNAQCFMGASSIEALPWWLVARVTLAAGLVWIRLSTVCLWCRAIRLPLRC
jgi:uncharacterized membrane protein YczE